MLAIYGVLLVLLIGPLVLGAVPNAKALSSLNPGNVPGSGGGVISLQSQTHVFYASNQWWVFWGSAGGSNGIYYESSPDGVTWTHFH
jgi:hypothetical protein